MADKATGRHEGNPRVHEAREHVKAARTSLRRGMEELIPKEFLQHRRAARREMLLAVRRLLDAFIERTDRKRED